MGADRVKTRCSGRKLTIAMALCSALAPGVPVIWPAPVVAPPAHRVKDINPGLSGDYSAEALVTTAKASFFEATVAGNTGLWITDGTAQGTRFLEDAPSGREEDPADFPKIISPRPGGPPLFVSVGMVDSRLFFANNGFLWSSDGTPEGTRPMSPERILPGPGLAL